MIDVEALRREFAAKLIKSGSMDEAFTKAVWVAFKAGIEAERAKQKESK